MTNPKNEKKYLEYAKKVLQTEADAILNIQELLDDNFLSAIKNISELDPKANVIISGVGKASFIAMKFSATLASIGVPSFLHPAEALHGDLGRYRSADIAVVLSNSGETEEIIRILPAIKAVGCLIISITGCKESTLGRHSDIVIQTGKLTEAGPLGLAPTTSTTVMLAITDAISMTVLKSRNFTEQEFAFFHPGGSLGRSLMTASDLMRKEQYNCIVTEDMTTRSVLRKITETKGRPGAATIIDANGKVSGIFTDGDLRRCLEHGSEFLEKKISEIMSKNPTCVKASNLSGEVLNVLTRKRIDQVIVSDLEGYPLGMIDIQDLAAFGLLTNENS